MAKNESVASNDSVRINGFGRLLARLVLGIIVALLGWTVITVHYLSIDVAVMQSQLNRIETLLD